MEYICKRSALALVAAGMFFIAPAMASTPAQ